MREWRIADSHGRILMVRSTTSSDPLLLPPRADLYQALIDRATSLGVEIRTSSVAAATRPEGVLMLESGEELEADLIVAADGAYSRLRELILATRWMDYGIEAGIRMMIKRQPGDPEDYCTEYGMGRGGCFTILAPMAKTISSSGHRSKISERANYRSIGNSGRRNSPVLPT